MYACMRVCVWVCVCMSVSVINLHICGRYKKVCDIPIYARKCVCVLRVCVCVCVARACVCVLAACDVYLANVISNKILFSIKKCPAKASLQKE
jgi:hypothetical protein